MTNSSTITFRVKGEIVFVKQINEIIDYEDIDFDIKCKYNPNIEGSNHYIKTDKLPPTPKRPPRK